MEKRPYSPHPTYASYLSFVGLQNLKDLQCFMSQCSNSNVIFSEKILVHELKQIKEATQL